MFNIPYKKFPKISSSFLKKYHPYETLSFEMLENFIRGDNQIFYNEILEHNVPYNLSYAIHDFFDLTANNLNREIEKLLNTKDYKDKNDFSKWLYYLYWHQRYEARIAKFIIEEYEKGNRESIYPPLNINIQISYLGLFFAYGFIEETKILFDEYMKFFEYPQAIFFDNEGKRSTQRFLLNTLSKYYRVEKIFVVDEPIFDKLLQNWKTNDLVLIQDLIYQACNYHTYQFQHGSYDEPYKYDLTDSFFYYLPFEILSYQRLRKDYGLINPQINHIIMESSLGELTPAKQGINYLDKFLIDFIRRIKTEFPDFAKEVQLPT